MSDRHGATSPQRRDVCAPRSSPSSVWSCGYAELGKCCASGPTSDGRCGLTVTAARHSDGALETVDDGQQLPPCIPRRSHRWWRQSLCINLAILTGGLLLLSMTLPTREAVFVPGELSGKHAQILDNTLVSQRCSLCHPNSHADGPIGTDVATSSNDPAGGKLQFFSGDDGRQDALCMKCHQGHMPAASERTPHDLSAAVLRALASDDRAPVWQTVGARPDDVHHSDLAKTSCATCHVEHHGRGFDLKAMADDRCQACHRRKFESFTNGHPEFENFPVQRPRALAFSHQMHADKHFPQKNREFDCRKCHIDQGEGQSANLSQVARSVRFESACAECHEQPIRAATVGGWAVLQLPSIDAEAAVAGSPLAHWPARARFGLEGAISPVLRSLLQADQAAHGALAKLPKSGQIAEVPVQGGQRRQVTQELALATERLIHETARDGQAAWRKRLTQVAVARTGRELGPAEVALVEAMCSGLPPDLFRQMQSTWFDPASSLAVSQPARADLPLAPSSDRSASRTLASQPAPTLDGGDALMLGDVLAVDAKIAPAQGRKVHGILVERKTNGILVSDPTDADDALLPGGDSNSSDDDLLLGNSSIIDDADGLTSDLDALDSADADLSSLDQKPATEVQAAPISGAVHVAGGGWYIDSQTLALHYMPTGHADATLAAWNMWLAMFHRHEPDGAERTEQAPLTDPAGPPIASTSIAQQIPGGCIQCHQLGDTSGALGSLLKHGSTSNQASALWAAWRVPVREPGVKEFTKFNHTPHMSLPAVNDCRYCHVLNDKQQSLEPARVAAESYSRLVSITGSPHDAHSGSEFRGMRLTQCVACHRPSGANSGCLQCHNYHVTAPPPTP